MSPDGAFSIENPHDEDVLALLARHLDFARATSPPEDVHALDLDGLLDPSVTLFGFRVEGTLLAIGALKRLTEDHAEVKSMHVVDGSRRGGIARALVEHLIAVARSRGF